MSDAKSPYLIGASSENRLSCLPKPSGRQIWSRVASKLIYRKTNWDGYSCAFSWTQKTWSYKSGSVSPEHQCGRQCVCCCALPNIVLMQCESRVLLKSTCFVESLSITSQTALYQKGQRKFWRWAWTWTFYAIKGRQCSHLFFSAAESIQASEKQCLDLQFSLIKKLVQSCATRVILIHTLHHITS